MSKEPTYREAMEELEAIAHQVENEEPDVDELAQLVKRAKHLIQLCKKKLKKTSDEIDDAMNDLED